MEIEEEEFGGKIVILEEGDDLDAVPKSHRKLLTSEILAWWADPVRAMLNIADRAQSKPMRKWFRALAKHGDWELLLHKQAYTKATQAGFSFNGPNGVRGTEIVPPLSGLVLDHLPPALAVHNSLVQLVDWMGFGCAGQLHGGTEYQPLELVVAGDHPEIDDEEAFVLAIGPCGDVLFFTTDDRAGWAAHDGPQTRMLGTVADAIDWVYSELLADRCPDLRSN